MVMGAKPFSGSYGAEAAMAGTATCCEPENTSTV
jgi:hypothetical protein